MKLIREQKESERKFELIMIWNTRFKIKSINKKVSQLKKDKTWFLIELKFVKKILYYYIDF